MSAVFLAIPLATLLSNASLTAGLDSVLRHTSTDQLVAPLRRLENESVRTREGAAAALMLGRLHFARGEYRQAADAFSRAAARLEPALKPEARYWAGISWLAMNESNQARAILEEVAQSSTRRVDAQLGVALAWEQARRPERAFEVLERIDLSQPSEAMPSVLERLIALGTRLNRPAIVKPARERLFRDFPRSIEAARAGLRPGALASTPAKLVVQIGVFSSPSRARTLANSAQRAGFPDATVLVRGDRDAKTYVVRVGPYATAEEAKRAGERAERALGVEFRVLSARE
jgi:tetratricopeptide (TPR) repeat protein